MSAHSRCELCPSPGPLTVHHLVKRSQGGDDLAANFVVACGSGTTGCHGDLERAVTDVRGRAARMSARTIIERNPEKYDYVVETKSLVWLNRFYPEYYRPIRRNGQTNL